jgi:hypothetical protein
MSIDPNNVEAKSTAHTVAAGSHQSQKKERSKKPKQQADPNALIYSIFPSLLTRGQIAEDVTLLLRQDVGLIPRDSKVYLRFNADSGISKCETGPAAKKKSGNGSVVDGTIYSEVHVRVAPELDWQAGPWTVSIETPTATLTCEPTKGFCVK